MAHIDKELFKFTENCIRHYYQNLAELKLRREYIEGFATKSPSELSPDRIDGGPDTCALQRHVERLDNDADIARLERMTQPIKDFLGILADEDRCFIEMRYFQDRSWYQIQRRAACISRNLSSSLEKSTNQKSSSNVIRKTGRIKCII